MKSQHRIYQLREISNFYSKLSFEKEFANSIRSVGSFLIFISNFSNFSPSQQTCPLEEIPNTVDKQVKIFLIKYEKISK